MLSQLKKYQPPGNLKFNYLGILQSLKLRTLADFFSISLKLNFTPKTLGCYYGFKKNIIWYKIPSDFAASQKLTSSQ